MCSWRVVDPAGHGFAKATTKCVVVAANGSAAGSNRALLSCQHLQSASQPWLTQRERSPVTASHTLPLRLCSWTVLRIKALLDRHVKSKHASPAQMPTPQSTSVQGVAKPSTQNMYVLCRTSNCCQPARQPKARFCRQRLRNLPRKHFDVSACLALLFCVALFTL